MERDRINKITSLQHSVIYALTCNSVMVMKMIFSYTIVQLYSNRL